MNNMQKVQKKRNPTLRESWMLNNADFNELEVQEEDV